jgi:hypothetical protein
MNHHEYIRELKIMDLHKILIHLIHIYVHVEQSRHLLFLCCLVCRGVINSHSRPLKNLKVTTMNIFIHMVPHSRCVDIMILYEVHTGGVRDLFQFKFFCDTTFNLSLIANHRGGRPRAWGGEESTERRRCCARRQRCGGGSTVGEDGHTQWQRRVVSVVGG